MSTPDVGARFVDTSDGLRIAVDEAGPLDGPPVVLVHGIAQGRRVWEPVLDRAEALGCRVLAYDLRGHGDSDKPGGDAAYADGARLCADLAAVIAGLDRPVLVPWSYGGVVVGELLRHHGSAGLGGILLAAAAVRVGRSARDAFGPGMMDHARGLMAEDTEVYRSTGASFARVLTASPQPAWEASAGAAMAVVPAHVRRALLKRDADYLPDYARAECPLAVVHGELDTVVWPALGEAVVAAIPGTPLVRVPGAAHAVFVEAPAAFDAALGALLARRRGPSAIAR